MKQKEINMVLAKYGAAFGGDLVIVKRSNFDPDAKKTIQDGNLHLNKTVWLHTIERIKVHKLTYVDGDSNGNKIVRINDDPKHFLPVSSVQKLEQAIIPVTAENIRKAVEKQEMTGEVTLFFDYEAVVREVQALNNSSASNLARFLTKMTEGMQIFDHVNNEERLKMRASLGMNENDND